MSIIINSPSPSASVSGTVAVGFTVTNTYTVTGGASATLSQSASLSVNTALLANGPQNVVVQGGGQSAVLALIVANLVATSPDGSAIPPLSQIITSDNAVWTVVAGKVKKNGVNAGFTDQVQTLLLYNNVIWQENVNHLWWPWSGTAWTGSGVADPRPPAPTLALTVPAASATVASPVSFTGTTNQSSVQILEGSAVLATVTPSGGNFSASVALSAGAHSVVVSAGSATSVTRAFSVSSAPPAPVSSFYGVNGHYIQGGIYSTNIAAQVADMQYMGIKTMRQDAYSVNDISAVAAQMSAFAPIILQPMFNDPVSTGMTEANAYSASYAYGVSVANNIAGRVPIIELMNEPENFYFPSGTPAGNGQSITDWSANQSAWPAFRGAMRGFIDGFRSIDTTKQTLIASPSLTWLHYGVLDGLWNGKSPNGGTGAATCRWDLTNFHWYYDMGDIENAGNTNTNLLQTLKTMFNKQIILSEVGVQFTQSEATINSYIASQMAKYASFAATYGVIGVNWYEMYNFVPNGSFYMGLFSGQGTKNSGRADAMKTVITNNPMA